MSADMNDRVRTVMALAQEEAQRLHHPYVGTEHLLLALVRGGPEAGAQALHRAGVRIGGARVAVAKWVKPGSEMVTLGERSLTPAAQRVVQHAFKDANRRGHDFVDTPHLILGLLQDRDSVAAQALKTLVPDLAEIEAGIEQDFDTRGARRAPVSPAPLQTHDDAPPAQEAPAPALTRPTRPKRVRRKHGLLRFGLRLVLTLALVVFAVLLTPYLAMALDALSVIEDPPMVERLQRMATSAGAWLSGWLLTDNGDFSVKAIAIAHALSGAVVLACVVGLAALDGTLRLARRSMRQHALSTTVTALSVALACGLLMSVFSIKDQTYRAFTQADAGFDAVLGARGSQLQLVLNSVYHLEQSPGNIPWKIYQSIRSDPRVKTAIPYAVGDNYHGFRIVGTTPELFTDHEYAPGQKMTPADGGRIFDPLRREAVIGSFAAQKTRLKVGDTFNTFHGLDYNPEEAHNDQFLVVGVLEPTNTPADRVLWIPLEGYFRMGGHSLRGDGEEYIARPGQVIPDEVKEVSAVMLSFRTPTAGFQLRNMVNDQGTVATLAWPIAEIMAKLFDRIGWVNRVLTLVAYLIVVVAAGSLLASIYNSMNERRREFAILRALGARRATVFSAIVVESGAISLLGATLGLAVYFGLFSAAAVIVRGRTGIVLDVAEFHPVLVYTLLGMTALGALSGIVPALKAYSTDVATNLVPAS